MFSSFSFRSILKVFDGNALDMMPISNKSTGKFKVDMNFNLN